MQTVIVGSSNLEIRLVDPSLLSNLRRDFPKAEKISVGPITQERHSETVVIVVRDFPKAGVSFQIPANRGLHIGIGGGGVNTAFGIRQLTGEKPILISVFGIDSLGAEIERRVSLLGIDCLPLPLAKGSIGLDIIDPDGDHLLLGYRPPHLREADFSIFTLKSCKVLIGGRFRLSDIPLIQAIWQRFQPSLYLIPSREVIKNFQSEAVRDLFQKAKAIQINHLELAAATDKDDLQGGLNKLLSCGISHLIVTQAERGGILCANDQIHEFEPFPLPGKFIDATGAGDATLTGFAYEFERTGNFDQAIRFARCAAAFTVCQLGGPTMPSLQEMQTYLSTFTGN